jgi:hypothetical protein
MVLVGKSRKKTVKKSKTKKGGKKMINSPLVLKPFPKYDGNTVVGTEMHWVPQYRGGMASQSPIQGQSSQAAQTVTPQVNQGEYDWVKQLNIPTYDASQPYNVAERLKWLLPAAQAAAEQFWGAARLPSGYGSSVSSNRVRQETGDQAARMLALLSGLDQYGYNSAAYARKLSQPTGSNYDYNGKHNYGGGIVNPGILSQPIGSNWWSTIWAQEKKAKEQAGNTSQGRPGLPSGGIGFGVDPTSLGTPGTSMNTAAAGAGLGGPTGMAPDYYTYPQANQRPMYY